MKNTERINKICSIAAAALTLLFIGYTFAVNIKLPFAEVQRAVKREIGFNDMTGNIASGLKSDELAHKNDFIDLSSLYARATDRVLYNDTLKLTDGMLTRACGSVDTSDESESIAGFSEALKKHGIEFLFVQAPFKSDLEGKLLPAGFEDHSNENADSLLAGLIEHGVNTLDLRPFTSATAELLEYSFYRTDHHWSARGAFTGFEHICGYMKEHFDPELDIGYADKSLWTEHVSKHDFLGSRGRRTGRYFGGMDDLIWMTPDFDTNITFTVDKHFTYRSGNFEDALIHKEHIGNKDYYKDNKYNIFVGGDYPISRTFNPDAPNRKKLLMIKDSFTIPVQAFMSTLFYEIDVIDPRHYSEMSILDYALTFRPDYVIMMITPDPDIFKYESMFTFGTGNEIRPGQPLEGAKEAVTADASGGNERKYKAFPDELLPGMSYTLRMPFISVDTGETDAVAFALHSKSKKSRACNRIIDLELDSTEDGYEWSFKVPEDSNDYRIIMYAGLPGETGGNIITCRGYTLARDGHAVTLGSLVIEKRDAQYNYSILPIIPEPGRRYLVTIGSAELLSGSTENLNICLYDFDTDTRLQQETIRLGENNPYVIVMTMAEGADPSHNCKLLLYAGEAGATKGISLRFGDIEIEELTY